MFGMKITTIIEIITKIIIKGCTGFTPAIYYVCAKVESYYYFIY